MDFNKYIFIMAQYCNYCKELPEATRVLVGCTGTLYRSYC